MIRRISKHNDLKDLIKSCPSGVIDDIYAIEYYIQGYNTVIQANFTKTGDVLEVILPSSDLNTLPNGVLMRRAYYKVIDASYPDGYYNLQFEDNMNVWLGSDESEEPVIPEYVTEEELAETLEDYVTSDILDGTVGAINAHFTSVEGTISSVSQVANGALDEVQRVQGVADAAYQTATQAEQGVLQAMDTAAQAQQTAAGAVDAARQAQERAVQAQERAVQARDVAQQAQDAAQAAQDSVKQMSSDLSDSVSGLDSRVTDIENADFQGKIDGLDQRVTDIEQGGTGGGTWGSITGNIADQSDLMDEFNQDRGRLDDLENGTLVPTGTATETWVQSQGYLTSHQDLTGYATQTWVQNQGYLTQHQDLTGYATQSWVGQQGYLDSNSTLPADQITCNISGDVFDFDDVDEGLTALVSKVEEQINDITSLDNRVIALEQSGVGGTWGSITGTISDQTDLMNLLSGYATQTWVGQQGYITSSALNGYATQQWATNQFLEENKVWAGTAAQWANLTAEEKASYKIALVTA